MEDGVKEDSAQCKENPKFLAKAGWVKKGHGRLLASYKERFIHVEKTEIVVYENEDLQNCLERLDLENYDKCHELKSPFKKKHRLILIRSPKTANKVHDLKLQAQTAEEKDAWIKALSDGINRAKNKIFDEVKVDESCNLEHVTRTRPKGNRNRRPPTRIHMKEVADVSSEGILRLDLDLESALMPNGTHHHVSEKETDRTRTPAPDVSDGPEKLSEPSPDEEMKTEEEASPQKKVIKPPMPPIKEAKPSVTPEEDAGKEDQSEKKVLKPPMPPSKDLKASILPDEEAPEETEAEKTPEKSPEVRKKTGPPPTPPNKPSSSSSITNLTEASQPRPNSHPPTPPSKEKKPSSPAAGPDQKVEGLTGEEEEEEEEEGDSATEETGAAEETHEAEQTVSKESEGSDGPDGPGVGQVSEEEESVGKESDNDQQALKETPQKSPSPPLVPKKKPEGPAEDRTEVSPPDDQEDSSAQRTADTSASPPPAEQALTKSEVPTVVVSVGDPLTDSLGLSPLLGQLPGEKKKKKKAEEKSVDSGQHSDDDSEGSGSEDTLAASTAALRGSSAGLDVLDASEDDVQISVSLRHPPVPSKPQILPKSFPYRRSEPTPPPKPLAKARSASSGNLLSDSSSCSQLGQQTRAEAGGSSAPRGDVMKLEAEVALEMEKTRELLSRVSHSEAGGEGQAMPEDLLSRALEKLKRADHVLREVQKLAPAKSSSHRKSW